MRKCKSVSACVCVCVCVCVCMCVCVRVSGDDCVRGSETNECVCGTKQVMFPALSMQMKCIGCFGIAVNI